jgi:regulator of protease activity HflC (stomatin/prohibitin superfamily)
MLFTIFASFALAFIGLFAFIAVMTGWIVVDEKSYVTTTLFGGRYYKTYEAGLHLKLPWPIESKDRTVSLQIQEMVISASSVTEDGAQMGITVKAQYSPKADKFYEAAYTLSEPVRQIQSYLEASLRGEINGQTVASILKSKTEIATRIKAELLDEFDKYGFDLAGLLVDEPHLSAEMKAAWERKLIAERNLDAARAEGEVEKVKRVMRAEAEGEALKTKTKALVDARGIMAAGNVQALNEFVEGIHDGSLSSRDALGFFNALDTREALRDASANGGKTVFISGGQDVQMNNMVAAIHSDHEGNPNPSKPATPAKPVTDTRKAGQIKPGAITPNGKPGATIDLSTVVVAPGNDPFAG